MTALNDSAGANAMSVPRFSPPWVCLCLRLSLCGDGRFGETMVIGYECARPKPHPDPYLEGLSRLGLSAEACVAFEDSINGVKSAVSAGLYTVGVGRDSLQKLPVARTGLCVVDYLDLGLPAVVGLEPPTD